MMKSEHSSKSYSSRSKRPGQNGRTSSNGIDTRPPGGHMMDLTAENDNRLRQSHLALENGNAQVILFVATRKKGLILEF